jgi:hypothetical protein
MLAYPACLAPAHRVKSTPLEVRDRYHLTRQAARLLSIATPHHKHLERVPGGRLPRTIDVAR